LTPTVHKPEVLKSLTPCS